MMEVDAPSEHLEASRSVHMSLYKKKGANWREELRKVGESFIISTLNREFLCFLYGFIYNGFSSF